MKHEIPVRLHYQITPIRRTGISRLKDMDGILDKLGYFMQDVKVVSKALYKEIRG